MSAPNHSARTDSTKPAILNPDELEIVPGTQHEGIQGWVPELATEEELRVALEKAFDYRGDVTLTLKDNSKIEGYVFDRGTGSSLSDSYIRVLPRDGGPRRKISYANIAALAFTGKDPAAGRSWEAWVRKYWEKKGTGEGGASIEPETLD
jgi:hypothetical protein